MGPNSNIPTLAHSRLEKYRIILSNFNMCYKNGSEIANADELSGEPVEDTEEVELDECLECTNSFQG